MAEITSFGPLAAVLASALAIPLIYVSRSRPNVREGWTLLAAVTKLAVVASMVPAVVAGSVYATPSLQFVTGIAFSLRADALGILFALLASSLWVVTSVYSVGYVRGLDEANQTRYFASFAASLSATVGVAFAGNLLTLFVFYELLTLATYPLVVHAETDAARRAGRRYLAYTLGGGAAVLGGTAVVHALAGSVAFTAGGVAGLASVDPPLARAAFALLVAGFGVKAALVPVHGWLPAAMVAPTPVSGLLHAVAVVKSGVFGIARVLLFVFGPEQVVALGVGYPLAVVATTTMILAGLVTLRQETLKRGLAYSTISQLSYIVLGLAVLHPVAVLGALLHLVAHAFMKITLFFCAGAIRVETHVERLPGLVGVGRRLPLTMTCFAVASAGLVGIPLVAGFVSKWYLLVGLLDGGYPVFAGALLLAGLLKLLFLWPVVADAFFAPGPARDWADCSALAADGGPSGDARTDGSSREARPGTGEFLTGWERRTWRSETTWLMLGPIATAAILAVLFGIVPTSVPLFDLAERVVAEVIP